MMPVLATKQPKPVGFEFDNGKHSAELEQDWNVNVTDTAVAVWLSFLRKVYAILIATALYVVVALNSPDKEFHPRNRCLVPSTSGFAITILDRLQHLWCGAPALAISPPVGNVPGSGDRPAAPILQCTADSLQPAGRLHTAGQPQHHIHRTQ
eukprot:GGOE01035236.1.p1 GENE.GGOE01035236.1~~GGOE01035236.1.p1  ORF type:complete len:152 (-),score=29.12 GGOE01035236.1:357-812(-)